MANVFIKEFAAPMRIIADGVRWLHAIQTAYVNLITNVARNGFSVTGTVERRKQMVVEDTVNGVLVRCVDSRIDRSRVVRDTRQDSV